MLHDRIMSAHALTHTHMLSAERVHAHTQALTQSQLVDALHRCSHEHDRKALVSPWPFFDTSPPTGPPMSR